MIVFTPLRTARLDVRLRELAIGDEIAVCHLSDRTPETALSEFLRMAVDKAETPSDKHVADPRAWTMGERYLVLSHYNSQARDDGPNWQCTESTRLLDYLDRAREPSAPVTFDALDDSWAFAPATGAVLEALEALQFDTTLTGRQHWLFGLMAAQLLRAGETPPDPIADGAQYSDWLAARIDIVRGLPASDAETLYRNFLYANEQATQFFRVWFDERGVIVTPKEAAGILPAARFLVGSGVSELAIAFSGKPE